MGMGSMGVSSFSFSYEEVKKLCPKEIEAIENHEDFSSWGTFALDVRDLNPANEPKLKKLIDDLVAAFNKATEVNGKGLDLRLEYYDEESGERYDEVEHKDGCIFVIDDDSVEIKTFTPAGDKFKKMLHYNNYCVYG